MCAALVAGGSLLALPASADSPTEQVARLVAAGAGTLRQAGSGTYRWWGFDVYHASLWVEPGFEPSALERQRYVLELRYLRGFTGRDIAQRSIDEMRRQGPLSQAQARRWLQAMQEAFPDVRAGDRLAGVHQPGRGVQFLANGRPTVEVAEPEFAQRFFGIWLSPGTSAPRLREALLGLPPGAPAG